MRWFLAGAFMVFPLVEDEQDRRPYITVAAQNTATAHLAIVTALYSESDITYASFFSRFCVLWTQPFKKKEKKKRIWRLYAASWSNEEMGSMRGSTLRRRRFSLAVSLRWRWWCNAGNESKTMTTTTAMRDDDGSKDLDLYCGLFEDQQK